MGSDVPLPAETNPFGDQALAFGVLRVCLARDDDLDRPPWILQQARESRAIVQEERGPFVRREPARQPDGQDVRVEHVLGRFERLPFDSGARQLPNETLANERHELASRLPAQLPELRVRAVRDVLAHGLHGPPPAFGAAGFGPKRVGFRRVPAGHMNPVRDRSYGYFGIRHPWKERSKDLPADARVALADGVDSAARPCREPCHVERLGGVLVAGPAESQELREGETELIARVRAKLGLHELGAEAVEARAHRRVRREHVSRARGRQGNLEGNPKGCHEIARSLERHERRMSFVEMADRRRQPERPEHAPSAQTKRHLLENADLGVAAVELRRDPAVSGKILRVVAVEQVERDPPEPGRPCAEPDGRPGPR